MSVPIADLDLLLRSLEPSLDPAVYAFVTVKRSGALRSVPVFASVREPEGLSAVILETDAALLGLPVFFRASWITLTVQSDLHAVGLTAAVSHALSSAGIGCNVVAGALHDHLFVPVERGQDALAVLRHIQRQAESRNRGWV